MPPTLTSLLSVVIRSAHTFVGGNPVGRPVFPLFLWAFAGCFTLPNLSPPRTSMQLRFDNDAMRFEVLKYLSIGMPIENAKRIMEESGFKCHDSWFEGPSCLNCVAVYRMHHLFISDQIHVSLFHESGQVSDIKVDCHSESP
jgi:hypothetical protein